MEKRYITTAMVELRAAINEAEALSAKADLTKRDEQRINVLLAKISALRSQAVAPDNTVERFFRALFKGETMPLEARADLIAGQLTPTYTQGALGGFTVPQEFHDELLLAISESDPFLDENVVTLVKSKSPRLRPYTVPGWDLSNFAAVKIAEGAQQTPQAPPAAVAAQLNGYIYKATLDASFEFEEDDFQPTLDQIKLAFASGFGKGIGTDLAIGNGTTAPQGVLTGATNSGITTGAAGVLTDVDFDSIYFKVDRAYRQSTKCAWAFSDVIYQQVRKAHDTAGRPLINIIGDKETLLGKPILISPSIPSTAGSRGIVFGDLSHLVVRVSRMAIERNLQAPNYAENGKALYVGRMRADSKVVDPSSGNNPPIVFATLHA